MKIKEQLAAHLAGDGTLNDSETDRLFRLAMGIAAGEETDLETVERWAVDLVGPMPRKMYSEVGPLNIGAAMPPNCAP